MSQEDFFQREAFAGEMLSMALDRQTPFSFGLDAEWGTGKTFFINNVLIPRANKKRFPCVVYDAFEHEKESDVFLSLIASILEQAKSCSSKDNEADVNTAVEQAIKAASKVCVGIGKVLINAGAKAVLKQEAAEVVGTLTSNQETAETFLGGLENEVSKFLHQRMQEGRSYKALKKEFQNSMKVFACSLSRSGKILVVIDELDRCTPIHALKVLEATNHILNTEGLIFMFSYNKSQLENMIEHAYGKGINASVYLQKFIPVTFQFPPPRGNTFTSAITKIVKEKAVVHDQDRTQNNVLVATLRHLEKINQHIVITPRMVQSFTIIALAIEDLIDTFLSEYFSHYEIGILIIFKLVNPNALSTLLNKNSSKNEIGDALRDLKYYSFLPDNSNPLNHSKLTAFLQGDFDKDAKLRDDIYTNLSILNTLTNSVS